jgi:hypothetical protein
MNGEPERGRGSGTESRHGLSLGAKLVLLAFMLREGILTLRPLGVGADGDAEGLKDAALTLSTRGDDTGEPELL